MGIRFRKSLKLAPGERINLSRSGVSTSLGKRGSTVNLSKKGVRTTVGVPGTGFSVTSGPRKSGHPGASWLILVMLGLFLLGWLSNGYPDFK